MQDQQVGITTNPNYKLVSKTVDGMITMGEVHGDNVTSGVMMRVGNVASPTPHFINMDKDGDGKDKGRKGTQCVCPGSFQVDAGHVVGPEIPGILLDANNGDIIIKTTGRLRIEASDIDIKVEGVKDEVGKEHGIIEIESTAEINLLSKNITTNASNENKVLAEKVVVVNAFGLLDMFGGAIEMMDSSAGFRGSTGWVPTPWTPRELQQAILKMKRVAS